MYTQQRQAGMGGMGVVPAIIAGASAAIKLIGRFTQPKVPFTHWMNEALADAQAQAQRTGFAVIDFWYDDVIRTAPDGSWSVLVPADTTKAWGNWQYADFIVAYELAGYESFWTRDWDQVTKAWYFHDTGKPEEVTDPRETSGNPVNVIVPQETITDTFPNPSSISLSSLTGGNMPMILAGGAVLLYLMLNPIKKGRRRK